MNNAQRFVFSSLLVVVLLEFGSFTKLQKIWKLAFSAAPAPAANTNTAATSSTPNTSIIPNAHPTQSTGNIKL